ncbi:hypothetical protein C7296_16645 [Burkholderia thailandensis]|nr:hypothetical protein [Burkholderia thailandensis]NOK48455.1 hypothetical protein [Burkholderia thailandensis]NOK53591.1 hypothetical protein [Burkholderia thailandensis]
MAPSVCSIHKPSTSLRPSARMPAYFASRGLSIAATDAPVEIGEIGEQVGWTKSLEHCSSRD